MKKIVLIWVFILNVFLFSSEYEDGKKVFEKKCSSCHGNFISIKKLKENFFEKDNKLLNLKAPTVNMLAYAIIDSPKKIGDEEDVEMRQIEIEEYLKSYLEKPELIHSICDNHILKYYDKKPSMKGELSEDDYINLSYFFLEYKQNNKKEKKKVSNHQLDENEILEKAKKENKLIMVYATSSTCHFCKKMEKEVLSHEDIKSKVEDNYVFVKIDVDKKSLPFKLKDKYKGVTPTFFVLNKNSNYITQYFGSWSKEDFITILKENLK